MADTAIIHSNLSLICDLMEQRNPNYKMYEIYQSLIKNKDRTELKKFVESSTNDELCYLMKSRICHLDAPEVLDNILQSFSNTENCQAKRRILVESVLTSLKKAQVHTNSVESIINRIVREFPQYAKTSLLKLVNFCLESIKNNDDDHTSWTDILPLLLQTLKEEKYISFKGTEVSGTEYKSLIVKSITSSEWDVKISTSLAKMFREMNLTKNDLDTVMRALCDRLLTIEPNEIPPLVHQLLRLGNDSRLFFNTLYKYFNLKYSEAVRQENSENVDVIGEISLKEIQEVESTVLYHIHHAVQVDHQILRDFLKFLKSVTSAPEFVLDSFIISVLLLNVSLFEDQIHEILKSAVRRKIQEEERIKNSACLRKILSDDWCVMEVITKVIEYSNKDRKKILRSLVDFAFMLMTIEKKMSHEEVLLAEMGAKIIQKIAKKIHESGSTILQLLSEKILCGGNAVSQYTGCLSYLCQKMIMTVLDNQITVVTLIEQLLSISGGAAIQVLYAILPLLKGSSSIRDTLVLVLRKALTKRDTYTRQMAVLGFLELLKNLKVSSLSALSQGNSSSSTCTSNSSILIQANVEKGLRKVSQDPMYNLSLCQELLSILRRCFIYDCTVRLSLYEGLYNAITVNPELAESVTEMLLEHFKLFYEPDESILPPIIFEKCTVTQGAEEVLQEPLGDLIFLIQKIYIHTALKNYVAVNQFAMILESLCKRMCRTEAEHLHLNETTDLLDNLPKSQKTLHNLKLTISISEALIAYRFGSWSLDSVNVAQSILSLYKTHERFAEFLKRSNKTKKGDGKRKTDKDITDKSMIRKTTRATILKLPNTVMDLSTVSKMLSLLYDGDSVTWAAKEQAEILRKRSEFHQYVLQTCLQLLCNTKSLKGAELKRHKEQYSKSYLQIGRLLFKKVISELEEIKIFDERTAVFALECFKELCDLMCNSLTSELPKFLTFTGGVAKEEGLHSQIEAVLIPLKVAFTMALEEEDVEDLNVKKIPLYLIESISHLVRKVPFDDDIKGDEIIGWLKKKATEKNVEPSVALVIIQLLLFVEERTAEHGPILIELCDDICLKSSEDSDPNTGTFEIINEKTRMHVDSAINNAVKYKLNNAVWFLARLKAEQAVVSTPGMEEDTRREELRRKERKFCHELAYIVLLLEIMVKTKSDPGPHTDSVLKNVQQIFNILSGLTKHYISKSNIQNIGSENRFKMLVQTAGKGLKPQVEDFITDIEEYKNKNQNKTSDLNARRNKILKETKAIPRVIYEIEQFTKDILTLSKKSGVELNKHVKHSTTRDFKINKIQLMENLERIDMSMLTANQNTSHNSTRSSDPDVSVMSERSERSMDSESKATSSKRRRLNSSYDS